MALIVLVFTNVVEGYSQTKKEKKLNLNGQCSSNNKELLFFEKAQTYDNSLKKMETNIKMKTASNSNILDSIYDWELDSSNNWSFHSKTIYTYDLNKNKTSEVHKLWNGSFWRGDYKYIYTYDSDNNLTVFVDTEWDKNQKKWINYSQDLYTYDSYSKLKNHINQMWIGGVWVNFFKELYSYDSNNNLINLVTNFWDGSIWYDAIQVIYTYDSNNNLINTGNQNWNGNNWENTFQILKAYDSNNNLLSYAAQSWNGNSWTDIHKFIYTYDSNNNQISYDYQYWNDIGSCWIDDFYYLYTYDSNNNQTSSIYYKTWYINIWSLVSQDMYTYDSNNNQTIIEHQDWNGNNWDNAYKICRTYNSNNQILITQSKIWSDMSSSWVNTDSMFYYYSESLTTMAKDIAKFIIKVDVYPNPTTGKITLELENIEGNYNFEITNMNGQLMDVENIQVSESNHNTQFDLNKYTKGIYFLRIIGENKETINKMIVRE